ncbi:cytochrome P450 [Hygrophoropsis aurantiaca]|uniref:Cytochrome P450 n=1 Tax=Hygrophoropsis aurantiaca TaxID=72124 RepID=A0ACB7ZWQ2_9AGAM|nr:cytochrome P450 [Hygrophoropsis aurantiaca]
MGSVCASLSLRVSRVSSASYLSAYHTAPKTTIARDPVAFPDPEKFDPQRWLDNDGNLQTDMRFFTFGFGRRVCPGQHVANRSLFINLALILWSFRTAQNSRSPIDVDAFSDNVISHAASFETDLIPRMDEKRLRNMIETYEEFRV